MFGLMVHANTVFSQTCTYNHLCLCECVREDIQCQAGVFFMAIKKTIKSESLKP